MQYLIILAESMDSMSNTVKFAVSTYDQVLKLYNLLRRNDQNLHMTCIDTITGNILINRFVMQNFMNYD